MSKRRVEELEELMMSGFTPDQARDHMGLSKGYFADLLRTVKIKNTPSFGWTKVGFRTDDDGRMVYYKERDGLVSNWYAFNGPVSKVEYPSEYVERLQSALEGELDGLSVDRDTACAILNYVLFEAYPLPTHKHNG